VRGQVRLWAACRSCMPPLHPFQLVKASLPSCMLASLVLLPYREPLSRRPLLHAMFNPGVKGSFGIELDSVKVRKAKTFMRGALLEMANRGHRPKQQHQDPDLHCCMVEEVSLSSLLVSCMHAPSPCLISLPDSLNP
jgi:hypothetical protein